MPNQSFMLALKAATSLEGEKAGEFVAMTKKLTPEDKIQLHKWMKDQGIECDPPVTSGG